MQLTTLCYIERDNCYLMLHRVKKEKDLNAGKWIGVGGKCEPNESPTDCLLREVREETGLALTHFNYRGIITFVYNDHPAEYMHLFTSDGFIGEPGHCAEGELAWIPKDQVLNLTLWEGDRIFLSLLSENAAAFCLKLVYKGDHLEEAILNGTSLALKS